VGETAKGKAAIRSPAPIGLRASIAPSPTRRIAALVIEFLEGLVVDVLVVKSDLEMDLRFAGLGLCIVELGYKRCFVPPLSPSLSQVSANRAA